MRMRKKRNMDERVDACAPVLIARGRPCLNLKEAAQNYRALVNFEGLFGNDNPVSLEIGCGNGGFITELAKRNPNHNYIAVEVCSNVVLTAMERILSEGIKNVQFLNVPAEILSCYLPEKSMERIYLNFSTPLPQESRAKQRLTATRFLDIYKKLLKADGEIIQKTDSEPFFDFSLAQYEQNGFSCHEICRDLHHSEYMADNVVTEYEQSFASKGLPIYRVVARLI